MIRTFAIDVIESFEKEEAGKFKNYLGSDYHLDGFNPDVTILFNLILAHIQSGKIEQVEKSHLFAELYPGRSFIESKFDKLMSDLKRLLERFLLEERYFSAAQEVHQQIDLATLLRQRGLEARYQQALEKARKIITNAEQNSLEVLFQHYLLAIEEREWQSTYNKGKGDLNIPEVIDQLESYYFAKKATLMNQFLLQQKATTLQVHPAFESTNLVHAPEKLSEKSPLLNITLKINKLLNKAVPEINDFQDLLESIRLHEKSFHPEMLSEFYTYLRNICVILIDNGQVQLNKALHFINQDNLERGYFNNNGKISPNACLNITTVAVNAGETSWASQFVESHKDLIIDENDTHDFYRMNKAICLFAEGKFEKSLDMIPFGSTYSFYHLMARRLELKIYYELRSDLLDHKIDAFKMFISRAGKKVFSPQIHELFTNFVNFVKQLSQSHGPQARQRSEVLLKRISEKKVVAERIWLLEKASELAQKK
jgi:hypothetical protein